MAVQAQPKVMGLNNAKVRRRGGTTIVELDVAQTITVEDVVTSGRLDGSGAIKSTITYRRGANVTFGVGGIPIEAFPMLFGYTLPAATGTSPNETRTIEMETGKVFGYFEIIGQSLGDEGNDVHIYVPKVSLTGGFQINMQDGDTFTAPEMSGLALPVTGTADRAYDIIQHETATPPAFTTKTLSNIDVASNIATATTVDTSDMTAGEIWYIAGATAGYINGLNEIITVPTGTTFTFAAIGADTTGDSGTASR
jgi:hypothetical protein